MNERIFKSAFAHHLNSFVAYKKSLGYTYSSSSAPLKNFDEFCIHSHPDKQHLSKEIVMQWADRRPDESVGTQRIRITAIRQFALFLVSNGYNAYVIPKKMIPKYQRYIPYIFSMKQLIDFFAVCDKFNYSSKSPKRHLILPLLFRLLYCCGLRVSEACKLNVKDVDLHAGVLRIINGKFNKDRLIPISDDLVQRFKYYTTKLQQANNRESFVFQSRTEKTLTRKTVYYHFRELLWEAGIPHGGKGAGPRIHDLRHTFAVHCLKKWVKEGRDLTACLPLLKTYLGHTCFRETAYYLRLTAELFPSLTTQIEQFYGNLIPQIGVNHEGL